MNDRTNQKQNSYSSCRKPYASFYTDLEKGEQSYAGLGVDQYKFCEVYNANSSNNVIDTAIRRGTNLDEKYKIARKCAIVEGTKKTNVAIRLRAVIEDNKVNKSFLNEKNVELGQKNNKIVEQKTEIKMVNKKLTESELENAFLKRKLVKFEDLKKRVAELESEDCRVEMRDQVKLLKSITDDHNAISGHLYAAFTDVNLILKHKNLGKLQTKKDDASSPVRWIIQENVHYLNGDQNLALLDAVDDADNGVVRDDRVEMMDVGPEHSVSQAGKQTRKFTLAKFSQNP